MKTDLDPEKTRRRVALAALLAVTCMLGARGIEDEASVMLSGDMARYVMDGVFIHDLILDGGVWSYDDLVRYAELYYARYPALSLGHHPPIPYLSIVPFFFVCGISLFAVRLTAIVWFVFAAWGLYRVAVRLFTWQVAAWAAALFVTNLVVLRAGQYLLSEMPMTALVLWAVAALLKFCETKNPWQFAWFGALVVASVYAKQLAVLMLPVYGSILLLHFGWRSLLSRRAALVAVAGLVLIVPMAVMTVGLSPKNFSIALWNSTRLLSGYRDYGVRAVLATIVSAHLSLPTLIVTVASVALLAFRRRRQVLIGLIWIVSLIGGSIAFAGALEPARYAFGALPAYSLLIGALTSEAHTTRTKAVAALLLSAALWWQVWTIRDVRPSGAGGYEEAAQYVLAHRREPAFMYHSRVDTGYFVFFVRKHDPDRQRVVLRADKVFGWNARDPEPERQDIVGELQRLGIRWIVVEDAPVRPARGRGLYAALEGSRFVERSRIPVVSSAATNVDLLVYEYLDAQPADLDSEVKIDLPLGAREYKIRLRDLVAAHR